MKNFHAMPLNNTQFLISQSKSHKLQPCCPLIKTVAEAVKLLYLHVPGIKLIFV